MSKHSDIMRQTLGMAPADQVKENHFPDGTADEDFDPPVPQVLDIKETPSVLSTIKDSDIAHDYVFARNMTYTLLELTGNSLAGAAKVAQETEHPRAYGVFNELAATMRLLTQDLLSMQKVFKDIKKDDIVLTPPSTVIQSQTNIIQSSTTDVLRIIQEHDVGGKKTLDIGDADEEFQDVEARDVGRAKVVDGDQG